MATYIIQLPDASSTTTTTNLYEDALFGNGHCLADIADNLVELSPYSSQCEGSSMGHVLFVTRCASLCASLGPPVESLAAV